MPAANIPRGGAGGGGTAPAQATRAPTLAVAVANVSCSFQFDDFVQHVYVDGVPINATGDHQQKSAVHQITFPNSAKVLAISGLDFNSRIDVGSCKTGALYNLTCRTVNAALASPWNTVVSSTAWKVSGEPFPAGWFTPGLDDHSWANASRGIGKDGICGPGNRWAFRWNTNNSPAAVAKPAAPPPCTNNNDSCDGWAALGECTKNAGFMKVGCCQACKKLEASAAGAQNRRLATTDPVIHQAI